MNTVTCGSLRKPPSMNFWRIRVLRFLRLQTCDVKRAHQRQYDVTGIADAKLAAEFWSVEDAHFHEVAGADRDQRRRCQNCYSRRRPEACQNWFYPVPRRLAAAKMIKENTSR